MSRRAPFPGPEIELEFLLAPNVDAQQDSDMPASIEIGVAAAAGPHAITSFLVNMDRAGVAIGLPQCNVETSPDNVTWTPVGVPIDTNTDPPFSTIAGQILTLNAGDRVRVTATIAGIAAGNLYAFGGSVAQAS